MAIKINIDSQLIKTVKEKNKIPDPMIRIEEYIDIFINGINPPLTKYNPVLYKIRIVPS